MLYYSTKIGPIKFNYHLQNLIVWKKKKQSDISDCQAFKYLHLKFTGNYKMWNEIETQWSQTKPKQAKKFVDLCGI